MFSTFSNIYSKYYDKYVESHPVNKLWDRLDRKVADDATTLSRADIILCAVMGLIGVAISLWAFAQTQRVPGINTYMSIFLQSDVGRVAENLVTPSGNHSRTAVHPISSILLTPIGYVLTAIGLSPIAAAKAMTVAICGANVALFAATVRLLGLPRYAVALFTALFISSACFVFWGSVIELFPFAGFTIILSLFLLAYTRPLKAVWWVVLNVLTLGITTTNWTAGLIATAARHRLKSFFAIATIALGSVGVLAVVQHPLFEKSAYFFNPIPLMRETNFTQPAMQAKGDYKAGWNPLTNLRSLYVTTVVAMPSEVEQQNTIELVTTNQTSSFPKGEISPVIATAAWVVLLGLGVWGAISHHPLRTVAIGVGVMLAFQTLLHSVYGEVTFLYSWHFMPMILLVTAFSWFSRYRWVAVGLAVTVIIFGGINNVHRLQATVTTAGCLSQLNSVKTYQSWDLIKTEPSRDTAKTYPPLDPADIKQCQPL
ncbi:hypothetical protein Q1W73_09935 [Asticcacaulis sp. ZE23SCel15]|uniref:hypothetical protein n=1 Tax=Asticcacaulis sp. ZE23SCel15 TaxID=3059027 RepID=UPI00265E1AFF|nr:hypothetical protein [Asticcacaulis sp. ZE23SCel15]WKL56020.1 hypothetical protein Q1W73_09935 [Asticcacaulis sp. ZE23SCel15]